MKACLNLAAASSGGGVWGGDLGAFRVEECLGGRKASGVIYLSCAYLRRTAASLGWAWTYWQFDSDFIVYDMAKDDWGHPIWKALVPQGARGQV
jgi:hypothetical protein